MKKPSKINDVSSYKNWLKSLKHRFQQAQIKAATTINSQLILFYWEMGEEIFEQEQNATWGTGFLKQLSQDLKESFPDIKGFSVRNLQAIRQWCLFWYVYSITQQVVAQLAKVPWGHNLLIVSKSQDTEEALYYVLKTIQNNWSRNVLTHQIEGGVYHREGKAITNFEQTLPPPQSDLAQQTLKDPYIFDFLSISKIRNERELEQALTEEISKFLLELGAGFAYIGKQVSLTVGERDFYLDLLFYHTRLHCYIVIELKTGDFEPEHAGKLNFYLKAVDETLRGEKDEPSIGILLCKNKDKVVAEYALSDIHKPMGISEYHLTHSLPEKFKNSLPTIEELENTLQQDFGKE